MKQRSKEQREHIALKSELTRAINARDAVKVKAACLHAVRVWKTWPYGWPDQWHRWNIASRDFLGLELEELQAQHREEILLAARLS